MKENYKPIRRLFLLQFLTFDLGLLDYFLGVENVRFCSIEQHGLPFIFLLFLQNRVFIAVKLCFEFFDFVIGQSGFLWMRYKKTI